MYRHDPNEGITQKSGAFCVSKQSSTVAGDRFKDQSAAALDSQPLNLEMTIQG